MTQPTTTRFQSGDAVEHNGRPAIIGGVTPAMTATRYHIFYTDDQGGTVLDLLGRVLSAR